MAKKGFGGGMMPGNMNQILITEKLYITPELKKKKNKLIELENTRTNHLLKRIIQISGGTNNG